MGDTNNCFQGMPSSFMALCQSAALRSSEMLTTFILSFHFAYKALMPGIATRHGPHHEAQKSTTLYLLSDKKFFNVDFLPSASLTSKSTTAVPLAYFISDCTKFLNLTYPSLSALFLKRSISSCSSSRVLTNTSVMPSCCSFSAIAA